MPATMYRGRPVLEQRPDESEDLTSSYQRLLSTLDNGSAIPRVTDVAGITSGQLLGSITRNDTRADCAVS
ncbi:hypothetical protein ACV357_34965, partial [Pseudomonas aeruginosa]